MSAKKYQFFIDYCPQEVIFNKRVIVKKIDPQHYNLFKSNEALDQLTVCIEEYTLNSKNKFLLNFCQANNIPDSIHENIIKKFSKIKIAFFSIKDINEISKDVEFIPHDKRITYDYLNNLKDTNQTFMIKILNKDSYFDYFNKNVNFKNDIILSTDILEKINSKKIEKIKYRLFINERLLVERFFPEDLPFTKTICEECFLTLEPLSRVKIVSDYNLVFTKIAYNKKTAYPNSTEFILEP